MTQYLKSFNYQWVVLNYVFNISLSTSEKSIKFTVLQWCTLIYQKKRMIKMLFNKWYSILVNVQHSSKTRLNLKSCLINTKLFYTASWTQKFLGTLIILIHSTNINTAQTHNYNKMLTIRVSFQMDFLWIHLTVDYSLSTMSII